MTETETIESLAIGEVDCQTKKVKKHAGGRPHAFDEDKVSKLIALLQRGAKVEESLDTIGVSMATYSRKLKYDESFAMKVAGARQFLKLASRLVVHDAIQVKKDIPTARWYLDREVYDKERQGANVNFFTQVNNFISDDADKFIEVEDAQ